MPYLHLTLAYSKGQPGCWNGDSPDILAFLFSNDTIWARTLLQFFMVQCSRWCLKKTFTICIPRTFSHPATVPFTFTSTCAVHAFVVGWRLDWERHLPLHCDGEGTSPIWGAWRTDGLACGWVGERERGCSVVALKPRLYWAGGQRGASVERRNFTQVDMIDGALLKLSVSRRIQTETDKHSDRMDV